MNKETKSIEVTVSQTLSSLVKIEIPEDFDTSNEEFLKDIVKEQIVLPSETTLQLCPEYWDIDDFCVML